MTVSPTRVPWSATEALQELILAEGLRPGDPMPTEIELSERLGAGRSTIREAMRTLSSLDIVEVRHGHGTYVGNFSLRSSMASSSAPASMPRRFRPFGRSFKPGSRSIAIMTARHPVRGGDPELNALVEAMATRPGGREFRRREDRRAHLLLMERVDNRLFGELVESFWKIRRRCSPTSGSPRSGHHRDRPRPRNDAGGRPQG